MSKQSSVEWLFEQFVNGDMYNVEDAQFIKQQALAMEKEEIKDAFNSGMVNSVDWFNDGITEEAEQYYNETYNLNKNNI